MTMGPDVSGDAALAIVESLLLSLSDRGLLPAFEIQGILRDAAAAHTNLPEGTGDPHHHAAVAARIRQILPGGHPVGRF